MNPFALNDALFWWLYVSLIPVAVMVVRWLRRTQEQTPMPTLSDMDPYAISVLRDGTSGALQLAFAHVTQRGLLAHEGFNVRAIEGARSDHPVEQALLDVTRSSVPMTRLFRDPALVSLLGAYEQQLRAQGLLPDAERQAEREALWRGAVGVLWLLAGVRVALQLSRGAQLPFDVMVLALVAVPFVRLAARPRRTWKGDHVLKALVSRVRQNMPNLAGADPWGPEHMLAAAVMGVSGVEIARRMRAQSDGASHPGTDSTHTTTSHDHDDASDSDGGDGDGGGEGGCGGGD